MKSQDLKKMSYSELRERRDLMLKGKVFSNNESDRKAFEKAMDGIQREMYDREVVPARSRVRAVAVALSIAVVVTIIFFTPGCQTLRGMKADIHWLTADVEHTTEMK